MTVIDCQLHSVYIQTPKGAIRCYVDAPANLKINRIVHGYTYLPVNVSKRKHKHNVFRRRMIKGNVLCFHIKGSVDIDDRTGEGICDAVITYAHIGREGNRHNYYHGQATKKVTRHLKNISSVGYDLKLWRSDGTELIKTFQE